MRHQISKKIQNSKYQQYIKGLPFSSKKVSLKNLVLENLSSQELVLDVQGFPFKILKNTEKHYPLWANKRWFQQKFCVYFRVWYGKLQVYNFRNNLVIISKLCYSYSITLQKIDIRGRKKYKNCNATRL